jgi:TM2 domain-containing membrane protein YozV
MAEITRQDIISDEALQAPLILAENFQKVVDSIENLIKIAKQSEGTLKAGGGVQAAREETEKLTQAQIELGKIQQQTAVAQSRGTDEYIKAKQALKEINDATKEKTLLGGKDAQQVTAQTDSMKVLEAALAKNRKAYAELTDEQARNSKEGQELLKVIKSQDQEVKKLSDSVGVHTKHVGDYKGAIDKVIPGMGAMIDGFIGMGKAALAFLSTGIGIALGALGIVLSSLIAYFKSSEEGQNRLNKIMLVGKSIIEQLKNFIEAFGEAVYDAFTNPQKALADFWEALKTNVWNRITGLLELIPALGKAINLVFHGEFAEAGKVAVDAVAKVALGVEHVTDKVINFAKSVTAAVEQGIESGKKLAAIQAKIDEDDRKLTVERARIDLEVAKLREQSIQAQGEAKRKFLEQAIALETKLSDMEMAHAKDKLAQAKLELATNGDDIEAKKKVADAEAAVINAEKLRYDNTVKFQKQLEALDIAEVARKKKEADDAQKAKDDKKKQEEKEKADKEKEVDDQLKKDQKTNDARIAEEQRVTNAKISLASTLGGTLKNIAGKSKELTVAGILVEKAAAISHIISSTAAANAKAVFESPLTLGMPWVAINTASAALGIINTVAGAAQALSSMPKFELGTSSAPGGAAIVGERGMELMISPSGGLSLTPPTATMMDVAKGTQIIPHDKTMSMLAMASLGQESLIDRGNRLLYGKIDTLTKTIVQSNSKIVDAVIESQTDLFTQGSLIYNVKKKADGSKQLIRKRAMGE